MRFLTSTLLLICFLQSPSTFAQFPLENQLNVSSLSPQRIEGELVYIQYFNLADSAGLVVWDAEFDWLTTLDHSVVAQHDSQYIMYVSRYLFDDDDGIEFLVRDGGGGISDVHILNEDETIIQSFENRYIESGSCEPRDDIQNIGDHAVMLLTTLNSSNQYQYSLPGRYNCCHCTEITVEGFAGCTYPDALNYNPLAEQDDQSCLYNTCPGDFNNNLVIDTLDLLEFLSVFGADCG